MRELFIVSRDVVYFEHKTWPWNPCREAKAKFPSTFTVIDNVLEVTAANETESEPYTPLHSPYTSFQSVVSNEIEQSSFFGESGGSTVSQSNDASTEPRKYRLLSDIYQETAEVELEDDMLLMSIQEPATYSKAIKDKEWKKAMEKELIAIEKKHGFYLTYLKVIEL